MNDSPFTLIPHDINLRSQKDRLIASWQNTYPQTPLAPSKFCITTFYKCSREDIIFQEKLKTIVYAKLGQGEDKKYYGEMVGSGGYVCMYERMRDNPQIVYRISGYIPYRPLPQQPPLSNSC